MKSQFGKLTFFFLTIITLAMQESFSQTSPERRTYQTKYTSLPPVIDGLGGDNCWESVEWSSGFTQVHPQEKAKPSQETAFRILYDDNNIYVFIRAFDKEPEKISRRMSRRDYLEGDIAGISIDSYFDKQTAFSFLATASGIKGDEAVSSDGFNSDDSWNPVWYLATSIDDKGWCAEMRIPFSQLRFGTKEEQVWGIQVQRMLFRSEERSDWQFIPKGSPGTVHLYGELHGIRNIVPKRHIELMPYALARIDRFKKEEGNPFLTGKSSKLSAGLDGKAGITNDLTLDFTFNPDFGQVEADPSEVNLTAFETYFSEKRPFFIEGQNIYQFNPNQTIVINNMHSDNLFYSRRIGRSPHYFPSVSEGEYIKMPESTTILGAAKLSGKTKDGLSVGILESITQTENALIDNGGVRRKELVEPLTSYFTGRVQKDFNKGETVAGAMVTAVNRKISSQSLEFLTSSAYTAGLDFQHNWKERTWYVAGNAEFSNLHGTNEAIINLQRSSARYYQRPRQNYLEVDSSASSLSGMGATMKLGRSSQKKLQFETSFTLRSPGLEFNDIGYMRYSDVIHHGTWVAYYIRNPFAIFNNFYLNTNYWMYWNFSGKLTMINTNLNFNTQLKNRWRVNGSVTRTSERTNTSFLRGGPDFLSPGETSINLNINSDQSKKVTLNLGGYYNIGDNQSLNNRGLWTGINIRPMNSLSFSLSPEYLVQESDLQYVSTVNMDGDPRYAFGELQMKTLSMTFRINYTINPRLTVEYYGQPFISGGKYSNYSMITDPLADKYNNRFRYFTPQEISYSEETNGFSIDENSDSKFDYQFGNPDFNFRQFRSNLVVRWEYLPGSTLYLVWSQGRTSSATDGVFDYRTDMKGLFGTTPVNVFLIKFSYWFQL